jgi:predicted metalloprotease with PDZ domain
VRFDLPRAWDAYTPWGGSAVEVDVPGGSFLRLRESLIALGDYLPHELVAAGARVELVTRGTDPVREDDLVSLVRACLKAHAAAVGPTPYRRLLIVADHPFHGDQADGEAVLNAAHFELSADPRDARDPSAVRARDRVVSHELFHLWNGGAFDLDSPEIKWFAEGVTEYYALRGLVTVGRLSPGAMADELAGELDRLRGNPWADSSLAALGRGYETDPLAWTATYAKGALAAWALDLRLADVGGLDPVIRSLVRSGGRPDLAARLAAAGSGAATGLLDSLSSPRFEPAVAAELAAHGLKLERRRSSDLTLGLRFFRPGTTEVLDLDPEGPAAQGGVRVGDRVVAVRGRPAGDLAALSDALSDAGSGPVLVRLDRRGRRVDVAIAPGRALVTRVVESSRPGLASQTPAPGELGR